MKNDVIKGYTMLALVLNVGFFVVSFWYHEDFEWVDYPGALIMWAISIIWIILVLWSNLYTPKKSPTVIKQRTFKMYDLKNN